MASRTFQRALGSYLLRVAEVRTERVVLAFELVELQGGTVHRFASVGALRRFLGGQPHAGRDPPARGTTRRK